MIYKYIDCVKKYSQANVVLQVRLRMHTSVSILQFEPPRGKTNNVVSEQVRHKPACTSTENR